MTSGNNESGPAFLRLPAGAAWDRPFAPAGHVGVVTTVDADGAVNASAFATCVRIVHRPVQIAFTTNREGDAARTVRATGEFVVNLPPFDRRVLEQVRVVGLPFAHGVGSSTSEAHRDAREDGTAAADRVVPATSSASSSG